MASALVYALPFLFTVFLLIRLYYSTQTITTKNPPPSPPKLPVIGNLHQIGALVHRSFLSLSRRYGGHLMLLHLGSVPTLVVSSADSAREIMQTQDLIFASKLAIHIHKKLFYDSKEIAVAPYGEYWRQAKKITVLQLLSSKKVQTFNGIRDEEISVTVSKITKCMLCNKAVSLGDLFLEHSNDVTCRATFGRKYNDGEIGKNFKRVLKESGDVMSHFYFVDFIPSLAWMDRISGANAKVEGVAKELDEFLEEAVEERLLKMSSRETDHELGEGVEPFIDALLRIQKDGVSGISFDRDVIKALLLDSYAGGTETSSSVLEWVMAELLAHPRVRKKLQEEVRTIADGKQHITLDDVEKMKYLKAVIVETTRLHPPVTVPPPRVATQDVKVMGFDIAKGTRVYINAWAIGRDPKVWDKPDEFLPERFIGASMDFVKHDFKFVPFGAGRRNCPGRVFGMAIVENLLANVLCKFDWALPDGVKEEDLDMNETTGIPIHRKVPLLAFATPSLPSSLKTHPIIN